MLGTGLFFIGFLEDIKIKFSAKLENLVGRYRFIGEFWYALELTALAADPIVLDEMQCEVGKTTFAEIELENPLGEDIEFEIDVSNPVNFQLVDPAANSSTAATSHFSNAIVLTRLGILS